MTPPQEVRRGGLSAHVASLLNFGRGFGLARFSPGSGLRLRGAAPSAEFTPSPEGARGADVPTPADGSANEERPFFRLLAKGMSLSMARLPGPRAPVFF